MPNQLDKLTIKGFKSIRTLENFELRSLNVLIGGNGAGKSNFIDFFRLLRAMMELTLPGLKGGSSLQSYVTDAGGSDDLLFNGPKVTEQIEVEMHFGQNAYRFKLAPTANEQFLINDESRYYAGGNSGWWNIGSGTLAPKLLLERNQKGATGGRSIASYIYSSIDAWRIYHFHDSSALGPMRRSAPVEDNQYLRFDASNIAPFLLKLHTNDTATYEQIIKTIRLVSPFFDDFILRVNKQEKVRLLWRQKGSDFPLKPNHLSDGTIRFVCLTTALLQPNLPSTFIIDEPELGLHPYAIEILAELIRVASKRTQLVISTQSPALVDYFDPEDIVVVNRENGASTFNRLDTNELSEWLKSYSLGDLWRKNVIAGSPVHE